MLLRKVRGYVDQTIRQSVMRGLITLGVVGAGVTITGAILVHEMTGIWPVADPFGIILGAGALAGAVASYVVAAWTLRRAFAPIIRAIELGISVKDWAEGLVMHGLPIKKRKPKT